MNKIYNINDLYKKILTLKKKKKTICLCHGVFDLLHIGHIRHFKECKTKSDYLIVSLTSDKYVNKGPDKPIFNESLRAEMIANLNLVDFIIINNKETSINLINLIKPNFYGKGLEYKSHKNDVTGNITKEVNAVKKNKGEIVYTDEITFSSSKLLNVLVPEKKEGLEKIFSKSLEDIYKEILSGLEQIKKFKVLVIGETIMDRYKFVQGVGKPPKEEIISTLIKSEKKYLGGVIAAAKHLQEFCKSIDVLTNLDDFKIIDKINKKNLKILKISNDKINYSITKTRYLSQHFNKKLFETYDFLETVNTNTFKSKTQSFIDKNLNKYDLVIVLDFGHGYLNQKLIKTIQSKSKFLALNVQTNSGNHGYNLFTKYHKANLLCIDHNELRLGTKSRSENLDNIMKSVNNKNHVFENLIITCGKDGSKSLSRNNKRIITLPPLTSNTVDTMGAGDAFIAISSAFSKLGLNNEIVSLVGNIAGSLKVNILGHEKHIKKSNFIKYLRGIMI